MSTTHPADDLTFARDDGSEVPMAECTREELLIALRQQISTNATLRWIITRLETGHEATRREAYQHAARIVAALPDKRL